MEQQDKNSLADQSQVRPPNGSSESPLPALQRLVTLSEEIKAAEFEVAKLEAERQSIIDTEAQRGAEFKAEQEVERRGKRYRITRVLGSHYEYEGRHTFRARYFGRQIKKDGTLSDRTRELYNFKPVTSA